ncbi:hypothetical protein FB45DRAFT_868163 [Roridomyces roridus]|uniref:Zn(2)-C6 fungal-type domain-containing protein n=1 Tax=Roridomyces roridus TaxID=1738132 RepID=A0AAD7BPR1_9AGAR|nr:hypothetical protein FB45DRAFT_868163 [Roridomyces roridus]
MSSSESSNRVSIACANCRKRKVKVTAHLFPLLKNLIQPPQCITSSSAAPCYRCRVKELNCEYIATERQARSTVPENPISPHERSPTSAANQPNSSHRSSRDPPIPSSYTTPSTPAHGNAPRMNPDAGGLYRPVHQRSSPTNFIPQHLPSHPNFYHSGMSVPPAQVPTDPYGQPYSTPYPSTFYNTPTHQPAPTPHVNYASNYQ